MGGWASRPKPPTQARSSRSPAGASPWWSTSTGRASRVKLIIPGAIDTEIWDQPDNDAPLYEGPKEPPEVIAAGIADAIDSDQFEHYLPDMKAIIEAKTSDIDSFIVGMRGLGGAEGTEQ